MKTDRRSAKTQQALMRAMSVLVDRKPYNKISVRDLIQEADVARSSFYAHFRDKDDLLLHGFRDIGINSAEDIFREGGSEGYPDFAIVLFRGAEKWKSMSRACLNLDSATVASHHMRNMLIIQTRDWLKNNKQFSPADIDATVHYIASALLGLLTWWVVNDFPYPAEAMSDKFNKLAIQGLQGYEND